MWKQTSHGHFFWFCLNSAVQIASQDSSSSQSSKHLPKITPFVSIHLFHWSFSFLSAHWQTGWSHSEQPLWQSILHGQPKIGWFNDKFYDSYLHSILLLLSSKHLYIDCQMNHNSEYNPMLLRHIVRDKLHLNQYRWIFYDWVLYAWWSKKLTANSDRHILG